MILFEQYSQLIFGVLCPALCFLVLVPIGAYLIYASLRGRQKEGEAQNWLRTTGTITQSQVRETTFVSTSEGDSTVYVPEVRYSYPVGGQQYFGEEITLAGQTTHSTMNGAKAVASRYPVGQQVNVYYHPQDPTKAILERRMPGGCGKLAAGIILLVIAACLAFAAVWTLVSTYLIV